MSLGSYKKEAQYLLKVAKEMDQETLDWERSLEHVKHGIPPEKRLFRTGAAKSELSKAYMNLQKAWGAGKLAAETSYPKIQALTAPGVGSGQAEAQKVIRDFEASFNRATAALREAKAGLKAWTAQGPEAFWAWIDGARG
jgi:hypothetical protein